MTATESPRPRRAAPLIRRLLLLALVSLIAPAAWPADEIPFRVQFQLALTPGNGAGNASIRIVQPAGQLRRLDLDMPAAVFSAVTGDGRIARSGDRVRWEIPRRGGELRYKALISHRRAGNGYDALVTDRWALLRIDDVFPSASAGLKPGANGKGELRLLLPPGWSTFTPYPANAAGVVEFRSDARRFPRPVGWMIAGQIGSRMDVLGGTSVRVAAPRGQPAPRVPMLALLRATLPLLRQQLPRLPDHLLIVTAGDPMWRGGLSAPNSLYLHADRPLISENATSPLLHELLHVVAPITTARDADWIDEGFAEYLALRSLRDSDTISRERFARAIETFRRRGKHVRTLTTSAARGDVTARAVAILADVDQELLALTGRRADIFTLTRRLMDEKDPVDSAKLRDLAAEVAGGRALVSLGRDRIP